jgi:hypothetical protein
VKKAVFAAIVLMLLSAALLASSFFTDPRPLARLLGGWSFTKSVVRDTGTYYRLKVDLTYKDEPQHFDIVVGCNVLQINYKDGDRTREVGLIPSAFGRRMSDGRGLVVRPPQACNGETTANQRIPPDLLPLIVVYDEAETLAFGTAYLSDDAYANPMSVLKFGSATIERADRAEFDQFRREQPNLVKRSSYHAASGPSALAARGLPPPDTPMGTGCKGYARFRLFGAEKDQARALWPAERPQYWHPTTSDEQFAIDPNIYNRPMQTDRAGAPLHPRYAMMPGIDVGIADSGMPRRNPVAWIQNRPVQLSYYPDVGPWIALPWPSNAAARAEELFGGEHAEANVDFRNGATRGFGYCSPTLSEFPVGVEYKDSLDAPYTQLVRKPTRNRVDGIDVISLPPRAELRGPGAPAVIVERDEFILKYFVISVGSTRGDV